ncbi:MAG: hypothetical protein IT366_24445 [Candidatus Hydrogenedentes bacterium]|nr:hypothetical protein [Candidatus Hydrogenedentota bacterium]
MSTNTITNAQVVADLSLMIAEGWKKVYVTTASKPIKTHIMWLTPAASAAYPTPRARAIYHEMHNTPTTHTDPIFDITPEGK